MGGARLNNWWKLFENTIQVRGGIWHLHQTQKHFQILNTMTLYPPRQVLYLGNGNGGYLNSVWLLSIS